MTWRGADGEIAEAIVDPRENTINGTDNGEVLTTQVGDFVVFAYGGDDTVYGLGGDDVIYGGLGADTLRGGAGDDTYILHDVHQADPILNLFVYDSVIEAANQGIDTIQIEYVANAKTTYVLPANVENEVIVDVAAFNLTGNGLDNRLTGNGAANTLIGGDGADTLDGGAGADTMTGGPGNDSYYVDVGSDIVTENANEGTDTVYSSTHYQLTANVENLVLLGSADLQGYGNTLEEHADRQSGANVLDGGVGVDIMIGGLGNDVYYVDSGIDAVVENPTRASTRCIRPTTWCSATTSRT